jgi:hypothetical protein
LLQGAKAVPNSNALAIAELDRLSSESTYNTPQTLSEYLSPNAQETAKRKDAAYHTRVYCPQTQNRVNPAESHVVPANQEIARVHIRTDRQRKSVFGTTTNSCLCQSRRDYNWLVVTFGFRLARTGTKQPIGFPCRLMRDRSARFRP